MMSLGFEEWCALGLQAYAHQRFQWGGYIQFVTDRCVIRATLWEAFGSHVIGYAATPEEAGALAVALRLMNPAQPERKLPC